ncbi:MAG: CRISPR-associated helicase Cas3' [bacterium]
MTHFWAKTTADGRPGISVADHMLNVGHVARCVAEMSPGLLERFRLQPDEVAFLAALHDLGKISPGFQRKCDAWLRCQGLEKVARNGCWDTTMEPDHGKVSHSAAQSFLVGIGWDRKSAKFLAAVLGGHHGRLNRPDDRGYSPEKLMSDSASRIDWDAERMAAARTVWHHFGECRLSASLTDDSPALWWLAGVTSVADWIGSDERFFPPQERSAHEDLRTLARQALDAISFSPPVLKKGLSFEALFDVPPNEMQEKALGIITGPGVYVIEAPTGMGKTEAALGAAYGLLRAAKANGIYFALPTQATSNRMHLRMDQFIQRISPHTPTARLIHGNSWLMEQTVSLHPVETFPMAAAAGDARAGRDWFFSTKRALLAPFGVGTVDQALLGMVAARHFFVRHFALAGKVVVLDEVHSYDLYTGTLIDKLVTTLEALGCTVIVLSATLAGRRRGRIVSLSGDGFEGLNEPYPLITGRSKGESLLPVVAAQPESKRIRITFETVEKATAEAMHLARKGGAVLWICNTVGAAQQQYRRFIESASNAVPVGLLHSRFPFWRREELEAEWMGRFGKDGRTRCGSVLVSTQVVEQSVDLDADLLVTELAPTDMLLQRLGRLWRHERGERAADEPRMLVIAEETDLERFRHMESKEIVKALGGKARVYAPYILLRSLEIWQAAGEVSIPTQVRYLIESTYTEQETEPASWQQLAGEWFGTDSAKRMLALRNSNLWQVALDDREGVQTRVNEMPTLALVLCRSLGRNEAEFLDHSQGRIGENSYHFATAQAIHRNLVRIPRYCFDQLAGCPMFAEYLQGDQCAGIVAENGTVDAEGLRKDVRLEYAHALGLVIEEQAQRR